MRRRLAHGALALAGVLTMLWAVVLAADPVLLCRDAVMRPGDTCPNAQGTRVQTYEERLAASQQARPVVGVVGGLVTAFAIALYAAERRRDQGSRLIGP